MKNPITTHVLDTSKGLPAEGVLVTLEIQISSTEWKPIATGSTNADGRIPDLLPELHQIQNAMYRLTFQTGKYYQSTQTPTFYPYVQIVFEVADTKKHYHVPLLLNPYGYSTYRGS